MSSHCKTHCRRCIRYEISHFFFFIFNFRSIFNRKVVAEHYQNSFEIEAEQNPFSARALFRILAMIRYDKKNTEASIWDQHELHVIRY